MCTRRNSTGVRTPSGNRSHPAGDVTRVSVMPRKVTVKIGDAENRCR